MIGKEIENFKFKCQKVLPLAYDDSLSYYEVLCKVVNYLNETITQINAVTEAEVEFQERLTSNLNAFKEEVTNNINTYKEKIDTEVEAISTTVSEIYENVNAIVENTVREIFGDDISEAVNNWLDTHTITGGIIPDIFSGTDIEKLQSAIDRSLMTTEKIILNRTYDITGGTLMINKGQTGSLDKRYPTRIVGGGITKNDSGFVFDSTPYNTSDLYIDNVYFESVSGSNTTVFNCDKIIRIHTTNCQFKNFDSIAKNTETDSYFQSYRSIGDTVTGGNGVAFSMNGCYDTTFDNLTIESRTGDGIKLNGIGYYGMARQLNIIDSVIEGLTGTAIYVKYGLNVLISGCYLEANGHNIVLDESNYSINIVSCLLEGNVTEHNANLIEANGRERFVTVTNCSTLNGRIIDASNVVTDKIHYDNNRTVMLELGTEHLLIIPSLITTIQSDVDTLVDNVTDIEETMETMIKGYVDVTIPNVAINSGYCDIQSYKPSGYNIVLAVVKSWRSSTSNVSFNVTCTGSYVLGSSGDTIRDLEIRYFYL